MLRGRAMRGCLARVAAPCGTRRLLAGAACIARQCVAATQVRFCDLPGRAVIFMEQITAGFKVLPTVRARVLGLCGPIFYGADHHSRLQDMSF